MKSQKIFWFILFIFPALLSYGQSNSSASRNDKLNLTGIIPVPNKGFILFKTDSLQSPTVLDFSYFNLDNDPISTVSIPTSRTDEIFALERIFIWNNKLIICSSAYQPRFRKNHLLYYEYSLPDLTLIKSELLLKTVAPPNVYLPYLINISPDSSKLVVGGWNYTSPKEIAKIHAIVFNKTLTVEKQHDYNFTFQNERIAFENILVDNRSKIYIAGNNYKGELGGITKHSKIDHFVIGLFPEEKAQFWLIKKQKQYFHQIKYALNKEQTLIGTGFWSRGYKSGIGFIEITSDKAQNIVTNQILFDDFKAAYKKNLPTFSASNNKFLSYRLSHLICKEDAYFIVGENIPNETLYADILVAKLSKEGDIVWLSRIPKKQSTFNIGDKFASFSLIEQKEKFYFLFNDTNLNYKNGNNRNLNMANILDYTPALAELALSSGVLKRKMLKKLLKKDYLFLPMFCQSTTKEEIIIIGTGILANVGKLYLKKVKIKANNG